MTKITSTDFEFFSNFYCSNYFDYFDRSEMTFYNYCCNDRVFRNFNTSLEIDSCRCRIYHHDFFCRDLYNFLCRDHRFDHYFVSHFVMRQRRFDRFDYKIEIDVI
jgi:hypothetical protein